MAPTVPGGLQKMWHVANEEEWPFVFAVYIWCLVRYLGGFGQVHTKKLPVYSGAVARNG